MGTLTKERFLALNLGDYIQDMHYGLHALDLDDSLEILCHAETHMSGGTEFIARNTGRSYANKMAVLVGNSLGPYGMTQTFAYSYDDRVFGMFQIRERRDRAQD